MEQHKTRHPQRRAFAEGAAVYPVPARPGRPDRPGNGGRPRPAGRPATRPAAAPAAGPVPLLRRFPNPRLTGLGAGLFASAAMLVVGFLDWLILDGSPTAYGLLFLPVSALTALWVRAADLVTAPIGVPIAFAVGIVPIAGGTGGFGGQAMAVFTALAVHAGWLYGGTLVAGVITCVRKVRDMGRRQRAAAAAASAARVARRSAQ
ncbi:DUF6542 domain-containing protein [Streptomyces solicathayae]|uniref:DUF6542 domain-containing protein n=1 Tax=Streptomyces solicathayae TaxID=3081768 RepID=UPI00398D5A0F